MEQVAFGNEMIVGLAVLTMALLWLMPSPLSWSARRKLERENRMLREYHETSGLIAAEGVREVREKLRAAEEHNEQLKRTVNSLLGKAKPDERTTLQLQGRALQVLLEREPELAPVWDECLGKARQVLQQGHGSDTLLRVIVRKALPYSRSYEPKE